MPKPKQIQVEVVSNYGKQGLPVLILRFRSQISRLSISPAQASRIRRWQALLKKEQDAGPQA